MTVDQWAAVVGFFVPALIAVINRSEWKSWVKAIVSIGTAVLVGTVTALLSGSFTGATWIQAIGIVFAASQVAYHTWWKNSGISSKIEQTINVISGKTSGDGTPGASRSYTGQHEEVVGK